MRPTPLTQHDRRWLFAVLAVTLGLRLAVWPHHLVGPDEGAHLMDGRLTVQGLIPFIDFPARRALFTYMLAGLIRLVGPDYTLIRLCIVLLSPVTAAIIFALGRRLFDTRAALIAAGTYAVFPLAVNATPVVQMQPFAILAACSAAYCLLRFLDSNRTAWLVATGALCAAGVQLRDSMVAVSAAFLLAVGLRSWRSPARLGGQWLTFSGGFVAFIVALTFWWGQASTAEAWWQSQINPFYVVAKQRHEVAKVAAAVVGPVPVRRAIRDMHLPHQSWGNTRRAVMRSLLAYAGLLAAAALASVRLVAAGAPSPGPERARQALVVLVPWILLLGAAYAYWSLRRGFFPEYALEFLPPLTLLFGYLGAHLTEESTGGAPRVLALALLGVLGVAAFAAGWLSLPALPLVYVAGATLALALMQGSPTARVWRWAGAAAAIVAVLVLPIGIPAPESKVLQLAAGVLLVGSGWYLLRPTASQPPQAGRPLERLGMVVVLALSARSLQAAGRALQADPGGAWQVDDVSTIVRTLRERGSATDEVLSGAVIWAFQSGLQPFARMTHPLRYELMAPEHEVAPLSRHLAEQPPRFIVMDGYTEKTFGRILPELEQTIERGYSPLTSVEGGMFKVTLYERRDAASAVAPSPASPPAAASSDAQAATRDPQASQ